MSSPPSLNLELAGSDLDSELVPSCFALVIGSIFLNCLYSGGYHSSTPNIAGTTDNIVVFSFDIMRFEPSDDLYSWLYLESRSLDEISNTVRRS